MHEEFLDPSSRNASHDVDGDQWLRGSSRFANTAARR